MLYAWEDREWIWNPKRRGSLEDRQWTAQPRNKVHLMHCSEIQFCNIIEPESECYLWGGDSNQH